MGCGQSNSAKLNGYEDTYIDFEHDWFAKGTSRRVYRGRFRGDHRVHGKLGVVKVYEEWYSSDLGEFTWEADNRAYLKARDIAQMFNDSYQTSKPIEFITPEFIDVDPREAKNFLGFKVSETGSNTDIKTEVNSPGSKQGESASNTDIPKKGIPKKATIAVERYLDGEYEKFSSNAGYVPKQKMATPAAFSHYSYHVTNGEVLVCDLQGVRTSTSYKLTDPAVHNSGPKPLKYGLSDLGKLGIVMFFARHKCNVLCEGLKKPKVAFNCTTGERVTFDKIAAKMPEGSVAGTYLVGDPSTGALVDLREILSRPVQKSTMQPRQLDISRSQIEQMQKDIELEEE